HSLTLHAFPTRRSSDLQPIVQKAGSSHWIRLRSDQRRPLVQPLRELHQIVLRAKGQSTKWEDKTGKIVVEVFDSESGGFDRMDRSEEHTSETPVTFRAR